MSSSIIKLECCQLDEIFGGSTGKEVAKYAIKVTCRILGGAIAGALIFCTASIIGCKINGDERGGKISKENLVRSSIFGGSLGAIGAVGAILGGTLSEYLCKKFNIN